MGMVRRGTAGALLVALVLVLAASPSPASAMPADARFSASGVVLRVVALDVHRPTTTAPVPFPCNDYHAPFSDCGFLLLTVAVSGLAQYGGLPACVTAYCTYDGGLDDRTSMRMSALVRCEATGRLHRLSTTLVFHAVFGPPASAGLNTYTRVDDDSALLQMGVELPLHAEPSWCPSRADGYPGAFDLVRGAVWHLSVGFSSATFPVARVAQPRTRALLVAGAPARAWRATHAQ